MANELTLSFSLALAKGGAVAARSSGTKLVTVSGTAYVANIPSIGTADEVLALGDVATNGYILLHNLDATNFITLGADGSSYPIKVLAGEWSLLRWNGAAIHAKADTAACLLEYYLVSN